MPAGNQQHTTPSKIQQTLKMQSLTVTILCVIVAVVPVASMRPTKVYLKAMENALDAEEALLTCRAANFTERLKDIECFEKALSTFAYNATWAKQAGALHLMTAQRRRAFQHFNHSYTTILEAQGFSGNDKVDLAAFQPTSWLKLYHAREKTGALELAKVWFQSLQMEFRTGEAKKLIDDFIEPLEDYSESTDLFRVVGCIADVVKVKEEWRKWKEAVRAKRGRKAAKKESETTINVVAEELLRMSEELANRWLSAPLTISPTGRKESTEFSRSLCGIGFEFKDSYRAADMVHYLGICLAKWGELRRYLHDEGHPLPYGALLRTPLHALAGYASEYVIRTVIETFPELVKVVDNFGATPLHMAAASGNIRALKSLSKAEGVGIEDFKQEDAGGFSPLKLGCSSRFFRDDMESFLQSRFQLSKGCSPFTVVEKFADDVTEDDDDDAVEPGGGWKDATLRDAPDCDFDVRSGNSISHHELIGRYVHSSRPIVLRGVVPQATRVALQRKKFIPPFRDLWVRHELFPAAEVYGGRLYNVTTIRGWTKSANQSNSFASIEVDKYHVLHKMLSWLPDRLVPQKEGYTTTDDSQPMLIVAGKGATTNFVFRSAHVAHVLVHGVQHWVVTPPMTARTTRAPMDPDGAEPNQMKCTLHSGDILVLPSLWGSAYRSKGESISFSRRFIWK